MRGATTYRCGCHQRQAAAQGKELGSLSLVDISGRSWMSFVIVRAVSCSGCVGRNRTHSVSIVFNQGSYNIADYARDSTIGQVRLLNAPPGKGLHILDLHPTCKG